MKKFSLVLLSSLALAACTPKVGTAQPQKAPNNQTQQQAANEVKELGQALQSGKSARCVMAKKDTKETATYVIKGDKMKLVGAAFGEGGKGGGMLADGQYVYTWSDDNKQGVKFKMEKSTAEEMKNDIAQQSQNLPDFSKEEDKQKYEDMGYTINCEVTNVADNEFTPPADVKFNDMSQLFQQYNK